VVVDVATKVLGQEEKERPRRERGGKTALWGAA
jgi:hypothetical protein